MTGSGTFRAFFAVPLDPPVGAALEAAARGVLGPGGDWRILPAANIHITLRFLGEVPEEELPSLEAALREAAAPVPPSRVEFAGWEPLPGPRDPRVLAVRVSDPAGTLARLAKDLDARAAALGHPGEDRGFLAHATVARRRADGRRGGGRVGRRGPLPGDRGGSVTLEASRLGSGLIAAQAVGRAALVESVLGPGGPVYRIRAEAALGPLGTR